MVMKAFIIACYSIAVFGRVSGIGYADTINSKLTENEKVWMDEIVLEEREDFAEIINSFKSVNEEEKRWMIESMERQLGEK